MAAKEQRALQRGKIKQEGNLGISLTLNIPGFPKSNPLIKKCFSYCKTDLLYHLKSQHVELLEDQSIDTCDAAGDFYLVPCRGSQQTVSQLKEWLEDFEGSHPLGRLVDADLTDESGIPVSSGKSKECFICSARPAIECRRLNSHSAEELSGYVQSRMEQFFRLRSEHQKAKELSAYALKSILHEIALTPKPGLVDRFSNGSHADMDFMTFIDSSAAISGWFETLVRAGFDFEEEDYTRALPVIRNIGLRMEHEMYRATGGVNTQKGIVFLLGLALFASGRLFSMQANFDEQLFRQIISEISKGIVERELNDPERNFLSHGAEVYQKYGYSGARGEAESGFKTIFEAGLPYLSHGSLKDESCMLRSFLAIASQNGDTNILYRRGPEVLTEFQHLCKVALDHFSPENYHRVVDFCREEHISPGGSADLLAVTFYLHSIIRAEGENSKTFEISKQ